MFELDRKEFANWLASRQSHFDDQNISIEHIAQLAIAHGFSELIVRQWQASARFRGMGDSI